MGVAQVMDAELLPGGYSGMAQRRAQDAQGRLFADGPSGDQLMHVAQPGHVAVGYRPHSHCKRAMNAIWGIETRSDHCHSRTHC